MYDIELKNELIYKTKSLFDGLVEKRLFPLFVANNKVILDEEVETLNKEYEILSKSFAVKSDVENYKNFIYIKYGDNNGNVFITPYITDEDQTGVEYNDENCVKVFNELTQSINEGQNIPEIIGFIVEPSKFNEFNESQIEFNNTIKTIKVYPLKNELIEKAELDGKLDGEASLLIELKKLGFIK